MNQYVEPSGSAATRAMAVAKRCAAVAGVTVALSALASLPAYAGFSAIVTDVVSTAGDGKTIITYSVHNTSTDCDGDACAIVGFSLPEYFAGDINFNDPVDGSLPDEWTAFEDNVPLDPGTQVDQGTATAYVHLTAGRFQLQQDDGIPFFDSETFIYPDDTFTFVAVIPTTSVTGAQFGFFLGSALPYNLEPDIPDTRVLTADVPEPTVLASLGIGGLAALLARRRRKS